MRRPSVRLLLALAVLFLATSVCVRAQSAKDKAAPVVPRYDPPDQPFRMAPMPQSTRSIVVPLATNLHLAFDTALLRTHTVWSGKGLALLGPQYGLPKSPFISTNDGTVLWTMPPVFPWAVGKIPEAGSTNSTLQGRFLGLKITGKAVFRYELYSANQRLAIVEESFEAILNAPRLVQRTLIVSANSEPLWFLAHAEMSPSAPATDELIHATFFERKDGVLLASLNLPKRAIQVQVQERQAEYTVETVTEQGADKGHPRHVVAGKETRMWVQIPPTKQGGLFDFQALTIETELLGSKKEALEQLRSAPHINGRIVCYPNTNSFRLTTSAQAGLGYRSSSASTPHFRSESFPLPKEANLLVGGMDFLPNGDLAICTWAGEVWIVEGAQGAPAAAKYRRFARGLAEPMGLAVRDGKIYVGTKQALYRLTDTDGNGEADLFECLNQSWGYTGSYNAFVYGPVFDKAGNFILANAGHSGRWDSPYMGWGIRISPDGTKLDTICPGMREPNGIGTFGPDHDVFVSENQGQWMAACKLNHVTPGKFYGHPSAWPAKQEEYGKHTRFDPPAVWFPYKLARSTTGIVEITDDRFGPFKGQLMVGDFQNAIVTRVQLEKVNGEYQGAVWPFLKQFQSGVNRLVYGPDGKLYVGGCQAPRSWTAVAPLETALERVSYTGKLPFEVKAVHALRDGFELTFTQPVEEKAAANPDSYDVTQYGFKYHAKYGSPELDHDGKENAATVIKIAGATVSPDKLKVRLKLEGWKTGYVTMVRSLDVKNGAGEPLVNDTFWYTLNQLPK